MFLTIGEKRNELETIHVFRTRISYQDGVTLAFAIFFSWNLNGNIAYILEAIDKMWKTNTNKIEGRGRVLYQNFFVGPKGRSLKEMLALGKSIQNSLAAGEQEAYRDGAPNAKKPTRTTLHFGAARAHRGKVLFDARVWKVFTSTSFCTRIKCSDLIAMSPASWCAVRRNGNTGQSAAFFF